MCRPMFLIEVCLYTHILANNILRIVHTYFFINLICFLICCPFTADDVLKGIQWSEKLDSIFLNNYKNDPTLSWQFFGSTTGFMRQFPGMPKHFSYIQSINDYFFFLMFIASKWKYDPVYLYDCRLRSWFIEAATSPKDMVILLDTSGSMMGQRKDIARHVVNNILDTLGPNDFVNIYKFAENVEAAVPCFNETLVQVSVDND